MLNQSYVLDEQRPEVVLETYILRASDQYQIGKKRPAVIVCPGGAYQWLSDREGEPIALKFNSEGFHSFVLRYRVGQKSILPDPVLNLGKAILLIKKHAEEWNLDADKISICGFSAGGHLCALYASAWREPWLAEKLGCAKENLKPYKAILSYPLADYVLYSECKKQAPTELADTVDLSMTGEENPRMDTIKKYSPLEHITNETVPCFIWHTSEDELLDPRNSMHFAEKLYVNAVPFELHIYETGRHGLALANQVTACEENEGPYTAEGWFRDAIRFLSKKNIRAVR